jgi:hypothetical protein
VEIYRGPRLVATHQRILEPTGRKYRLPEHRHQRDPRPQRRDSCPEEKLFLARLPEAAGYLEALKKRYPGRVTLPLRRLLVLVNDYPRAPLLEVLQAAMQYGLFDLERVNGYDLVRITPTPILLRRRSGYFSRAFSACSLVLNGLDNGVNSRPRTENPAIAEQKAIRPRRIPRTACYPSSRNPCKPGIPSNQSHSAR